MLVSLRLAPHANLPARWTAFKNTLTLAPVGTGVMPLAACPLAGAALPAALAAVPARAGDRAVLDQPAHPHLRLDLHPRRARAAGAPRLAGLGEPRLINTPFAVLPGIVYGYLPLMVFPIHVSLERLDRRLLEASMDLCATPWATFRQATLPQLLPAIAASFLLAFAFSFNDFVIVFFVAGPNTTLPISILASIRRGVTPERRRQRA